MSPKLPAPTRSPEAPVEETAAAAAVRNVTTSDDGSEIPDAEPLSIGNHAMAAQGLRQTDVRVEPGASVAGEVLLLKPEGVGPSLMPSS